MLSILRRIAWLAGPALVIGLALTIGGGPAAAEGPGAIGGRIINGTAGGPAPAGAELLLHTFKGREYTGERPIPAEGGSAYRVGDLEVGDEYTYAVSLTYGGVSYDTGPLKLTTARPEATADLTVYETAPADPGLRADRAALILSGIDGENRVLGLSELVKLVNPTDRTFLPSPGVAAGPRGLVRFGLPAGARDLRPTLGFDPAAIIQVDRGFGSLAPVLPGSREYGFVYQLPFEGDRVAFEKSLPYGASTFEVYAPVGGPDVAADGLGPAEEIDLGTSRLRVWTARDLPPGTRLTIELRGLPPPSIERQVAEAVVRPGVVPSIFGIALIAGAIWAWRARRRSVEVAAEDSPEPLIEELADLDDEYAAGGLDETTYRSERAAIKQQLRGLIDRGVPLAAPDPADPAAPRPVADPAGTPGRD